MARLKRGYSGERRTEHFSFQLTPSEKDHLKRLAEGARIPKSEVVRSYLPLGGARRRQDTAADDTHQWRRAEPWRVDAVRAINAIGININQLARAYNGIGDTPEAALLRAIAAELRAALANLL